MGLVLITHVACKKETGSIGLDAGDSALNPLEIDTFTLVTRTVLMDSVRAEGLSYQLLGATKTAEFGYNEAGVAMSFGLPTSGFTFPAGITIDSIVLQAVYTGTDQYNGNLATPMDFEVAQLDEYLSSDSSYYSNRTFATVSPSQLNGIVHNLQDSVKLVENGVQNTYAPHLRLKMGQDIVNHIANASSTNLGSNSAFQEYFNGLRIRVAAPIGTSGEGNIVYLNLNSAQSGLAVYFNDTGKYLFPVAGAGVTVNTFRHDFSQAIDIQTQLNSADGNFDQTYVQSMAGLRTRIDIPTLFDLLDDGVYAVSDAMFRFYYDETANDNDFPAFSRTLLLKRDSSGANDFVADQLLNASYYGGSLNSTDHYYEFHITREIQDILNNYRINGLNRNTGFYVIAPTDNPVSASHLLLDTRKNTTKGVRFVVKLVKTK